MTAPVVSLDLRDLAPPEPMHRILDAIMFRVELPATDRRLSGFFDVSDEPACRWRVCAPHPQSALG